jgi:tetratricopeptide (TPR) repeat protein
LLAKRLARHGLAVSGGALATVLSQVGVASASAPTAVVVSTIKTASLVAAGKAAAPGLISAKVAALTEGVIKAMLVTKLKTMTIALVLTMAALAFSLVAVGTAKLELMANEKPKVASKEEKEPQPAHAPDRAVMRDNALAKSLEAAEQIEMETAKVQVMADIAVLKARAGDAAGAKKTIETAAKMADEMKGPADDKASALAEVAYAQARLGQRDNAVRTFKQAQEIASKLDPKTQLRTVYSVVRALVVASETDWGWEIWDDALRNDPIAKKTGSWFTADLVRLLAESGDLARAQELQGGLRGEKKATIPFVTPWSQPLPSQTRCWLKATRRRLANRSTSRWNRFANSSSSTSQMMGDKSFTPRRTSRSRS